MTNKRTKKQIIEDAKAMRELNEWSRKVFGYTKNGWLYVDNKPVSYIGNDDEDEQFLFSQLIATSQTHDTTTPQSTHRTKSYDSKQKRLFRYDIIYHFVFWCELLRPRTYRGIYHPTNPSEISNAHTQYTTPAQCGFFIVCWLHYPPHPTDPPRTKHHMHRPPHPQATAGGGLQMQYISTRLPRTY